MIFTQVIKDATAHGAAVLGVPVKATIKEVGTFCQFLSSFLLSMCVALHLNSIQVDLILVSTWRWVSVFI
jgi:hypothetical protein